MDEHQKKVLIEKRVYLKNNVKWKPSIVDALFESGILRTDRDILVMKVGYNARINVLNEGKYKAYMLILYQYVICVRLIW